MESEERFKFESLEDAARVCGQMAREIENHHAMTFGLQTILLALMATHHEHEQMQLATTTFLEHLLAKMPEKSLSAAQGEKVRNFVEGLQQGIKPMPKLRPRSP
jgi:hypothetical protein